MTNIALLYRFLILGMALTNLKVYSQVQTYQLVYLDENGEVIESSIHEYPEVKLVDYCSENNPHLNRFCSESTTTYQDLNPRARRTKNVKKIKKRDLELLYSSGSFENKYPALTEAREMYNEESAKSRSWSSHTKLDKNEVIRLFNLLNQKTQDGYSHYRDGGREIISSTFKKDLDQKCYDLLTEIGNLKDEKNITDSSMKSVIFFISCTT